MTRVLRISGIAAAAAILLAGQVNAACGSCGSHGKAKACDGDKACKTEECKRSCDAKKKACSMKEACADKSMCAQKKGACEAKQAKQCTTKTCGTPEASGGHDVAEINTQGLKALLDSRAKIHIFDARTGKYDDGRRIPGAKSLAADATEKEIEKAIRRKDALVVTYCSNLQCPASAMLAKRLKSLGYESVIEYPYGIDGWAEAGLPVKNAK